MPRLDQLLTEEEMKGFLQRAAKEGYASGREPESGYLPGVRTLPTYTDEIRGIKLVVSDSWVGRGGTGGQEVVLYSEDNGPPKPGLLIQYHGGQPQGTPLERVREINTFLRKALLELVETARLTGVVSYKSEEDGLSYWGMGRGGIWDFTWIEVITDFGIESRLYGHPFYQMSDPEKVLFRLKVSHRDIHFWHFLTHQLVW